MEGQSSATTASPQPVPVDEMRSTRDSTAAQESDRGYECCDWAGTDKNVPECETGNKGASTSCTPSVGEIRSQHDTIVYVLQDVQSNKMVIQVPVIADESGVINCAESGLAESKDTPTVVRDPQATSLTGPDCDSLDVPDKAGNKSSTYDVTECSSHVDLVTGESHSDKTITVLSTDTHNRTTIVECNSRFIPQVDLTQTTSCTKNSSPQIDTEAQKEGNLGHHLLDAAVGGKCFSTSGDSLLSETTNYKQISEDGKEGEKSLGVTRIGTGGVEDKVKTAHKLLMAASSCQSGSLPPFSLSMLITDRKQQGQTKKGAWGRSGLFNKETSTVVRKRSTELSENQNVFEEGPHAAQPEEQQQMLSCDTKVLSHNEEQALGHAPKGLPEMEKNSESGSISDDTACEAKDGDSGLIFVEPGKKSEPLTEDEDMEEAGSGNMHIGHPDCSSANAVKATDVVTWEGSILQVKDNSGEDYIGNSEEKLMEEDMGSTKGKTSKSIEVSIGLDEKMTAEENMPEVGNSESTSNKSEAFPREANRPDQCKEEIQSEHLHKWRQSFTCNICSYTAFSVKDIEDHCIRCEQENAVPDNKEVNDNESDEMECEEVINDSTSVGSVLQLTDSSHCDALKERPHAKVLPDKTGPTISECDLPSPPDAQSTPVILSKQNSTVVQDGSPSPLQNRVLAGEGTPSDNVQAKHVTRGKKRSRRNIHQGEDHIIAGWKAIVVHPPRGLVRTRTFWHCPDCPYKTDKIYPSIKEHAARHVVSEKFQCDHCTYSCQTQNGIRSHRRMHERDGDPKPGKKDKFEVQVLARQLRRRLRKNRRVYRCYKCSFVTSVHSSFEKHCKRHTRKSKISRIHTQSGNDAMMGESTTTDPDLHNELNDGRDLETHEANRSEGETNKAQSPASVANKKLEGQDVEKDDDKCLQRELEVLSETSGSSFTNLSPSEGNAISPRQRAKTKKYSCIKCSFSCNSWLSVKAHMAVHKEGLTNTAMEIESYTDKEELANKLEEMDANDKIACVTVEAQDSSPKKSENIYRCTKCPFTCDRIGWLTKHMKHHEFSQKFSCDLCSYSASHKISLINHQSVHVNDIKKGSTAGAPKVTTSTEGCNREESSTNVADKQQLLYRCKECPYTADHSSILERHEKCHGIWRWHKRLGEMSHAGEQAVSEATVSVAIACNDDTSDSGNPADVALKESNTEVTESREEESRKLHTCNECHFKTDSLFELERHKTSHGSESKHMCNNNDVPSDSKTSEEHHGDNEKGHNNRQDNEDAIMEDQGAEDCETESVITTSAVPSADITVQKEDDKARQTSLISKPKVDEYKYIFHCEDCPFKTDWFHDLQKHKNGHDNEADFSCDKCSFSAATKGAIEVHRRVHRYKGANREAKQCTEHAFSTHSFKSMHLHMQTHNNSDVQADVDEWVASPLPCSDTQKPSTSSMEGGMFRRKMEEYLYIFNCEQCPFKTDWYHELEKHRMGHNANLEFPCDHCTFSSSSKKAVEVHKRVHKDGNALKMERSVADKPNACMSKEEKDKEKEKPRRFPHMTPSGLRYYNHKCPKCPFRTDSRKKVGVHLVHHGAKGKYNCDLCTYSSNHQAALAVHRRVHLHGYDNPHANKGMPIKDTPNDVKNESKRLSPQKSQKCTKCPFKTDSRKKMDVHMVFHRKRGKYKCNLCSYSTDRMSTLGPHRKVHLKHQEAAERSARNVNNEMGVVHSPLAAYRTEPRLDSGQKYSCNACPSKFNSLLDVREHVSHHLRQFSYSCPECTYGADSERSVKSHKGVHERHGDKKCRPVIKHATQATNDLALHSAEEDERPAEVMIKKRKYQCEHCPYSTDKLHKKSSHESNHGANHPNKCHLCSYSTSASIKVHLRVHEKYVRGKTKGQKVDTAGSILTVEKIGSARDRWQYKCSQCPYLAKTASYVRSHQRYHSADLPLKCPDCTFSCSRLQQLSCHAEWHGKPPAQDKQQSSPEVKQKPTKRGRIGTLQQKLYEQGVERIMINGKKHYICPHCPFRSRWADQAVAHLEHHFVMYSYKCAHCSYSTRTKDKVKFHMNLHKKVADDGNGHSTDGGKRLARTAQRDNEAASSPSEAGLTKGPRTRARLGVIGQSPVKHTTPQVSPTSSSVSRNLGDFSSPSGSESAFIRYMTPSCSKEQPEQGQQVTVLTFVCMYCERPFTDQESWLAHMKRHRL